MAVLLETIKYITLNQVLDVLSFPLWWYTKGLVKVIRFINQKRKDLAGALALRILLANLFKPMFGQYDRLGRLISFFMRCFQLSIRLFLFLLGLIGLSILLILWLALPIFAGYQIIILIF
jgi:hypothetical protein